MDFVSCSLLIPDTRHFPGLWTNQNLSFWGSSGQSEPQLLEQLWPIRSSASGAALANPKLSFWSSSGFHTKPPIMPYFPAFRSVLFIIQRRNPNEEIKFCHLATLLLSVSVFVFCSHRMCLCEVIDSRVLPLYVCWCMLFGNGDPSFSPSPFLLWQSFI